MAPATSAHDVVVRGAAAVALVLEGVWIVGDPALWPWRQPTAARAVALGVVVLTWVGLLVARWAVGGTVRRIARSANAIALTAAAVLVLAGTATGTGTPAGVADVVILAAAGGGLLLGSAGAVGVLVVLLVAQATAIAVVDPASTDLVHLGLTFAVGVATIAARTSLLGQAVRADSAWATTRRLEAERRVRDEVAATLRARERALHSTVLNTLAALERGGLPPALRPRVVERCVEAAEVLTEITDQAGQPRHVGAVRQRLTVDLHDVVTDLRAAGIEVRLAVDDLDAVPPATYLAIRAAVREALANTLRHSTAATCDVRVAVGGEGPGLAVAVDVHDDGVGFDPAVRSGRFGLARGIVEPMREVGGRASVHAQPGAGTTVRLTWVAPPATAPPTPYQPAQVGLAAATLTAFAVFTLASFAVSIDAAVRPALDAVALAVILGVYALLVVATGRRRVSWWVTGVTVLGATAAYALQHLAGLPPDTPWADWSSFAVVMAYFVVAAAGPRWAWAVVLAAWFAIQGDVVAEAVSPGTAVLLGGAIYGRSTRRNVTAVATARAAVRDEEIGLDAADASVRQLRERYVPLRQSNAGRLLRRIADGRADPDDPVVRHAAGVEERFIRTVIRTDPGRGQLPALAITVAAAARAAGVSLACDVDADGVDLSGGEQAMLRLTLLGAIALASPDTPAALSIGPEDGRIAVRLTARVPSTNVAAAVDLPLAGFPAGAGDAAGQPMLWQWRSAVGR